MSCPHLLRAAALDIWVAARERAISHVSAEAIILEGSGASADAAHLRYAAEHLSLHMKQEKAEAELLRAASDDVFARISLQ